GWYLLPAIAGFLSKAPALIYPLIQFAYIFLMEADRKWLPALRATLPALAVAVAAAVLTFRLTPSTYLPRATTPPLSPLTPPWLYRLTQPWIALRYFGTFFLPINLNADHGWDYVSGRFSEEALVGYVFLAVLVLVVIVASRRPANRPAAFGLTWFVLALVPV